jgi:hypothetical protein
MAKYKNRVTINQRGAAIDINNTTDEESITISQRSGSNTKINNVVNSELATNNKQVAVVNDNFKTVGGDSLEFIARNKTERTGEDSYELDGFISESEIDAYKEWKESWKEIALLNSRFKIKRGGVSYPNGEILEQSGSRASNPVASSTVFTVQNIFNGYSGLSVRYKDLDEVAKYTKVLDKGKTKPAEQKPVTITDDIIKSLAPAILEFGPEQSAATEGGQWSLDSETEKIDEKILEKAEDLFKIEQKMGNGGNKIKFIKRDKFEQVGAAFNDFPSIRVDTKGRSQPFEMAVGKNGAFKNHDYASLVEEVDNASCFPGGNDIKTVGNSYIRNVGSGGISFKTTGSFEQSGATLKMGFKKININASNGLHIGSEDHLEIQSLKSITLRTNKQVYVESSMGIKNNLIIGGANYTEGETYVQHVTAPLEVQRTENTVLFGKFATDSDRRLVIGECLIGDVWYPVYAMARDELIINYPHSHHFHNIPLRLMKSNELVREQAHLDGINDPSITLQSLQQLHERK